jgi:hypothetical protein
VAALPVEIFTFGDIMMATAYAAGQRDRNT